MEDRTLDLDVGAIKISVKLDTEGVFVSVFKKKGSQIGFCRKDELINSTSKTYSEFGIEIKELPDEPEQT
tara:strand:+ start:1645 stop:1854 length:210 start_codon:yes stop_codon:yes gene_type:complete